MQANPPPFTVALINLGTPARPDRQAVRSYLKTFLSDRRVVDLPRWLWWLILNGIILNVRPGRVAKLYKAVWMDEGSPLLVHSRRLAARIEQELSEVVGTRIPVHLAMTYGEPGMPALGKAMREYGHVPMVVLPLFPQYSATTTGAAFDALAKALGRCPDIPQMLFVREYATHEAWVEAIARSIEQYWSQHGAGDRLLFSFHGIPERYQQQGDPYPAECLRSAEQIVARLGLQPGRHAVSFQSRFGREEWVKPYTDDTLKQWGHEGLGRVDVICPGFAADCLETLEEIEVQNKELFLEAGGKALHYIPCLNDRPEHAQALSRVILSRLKHSTHPTGE